MKRVVIFCVSFSLLVFFGIQAFKIGIGVSDGNQQNGDLTVEMAMLEGEGVSSNVLSRGGLRLERGFSDCVDTDMADFVINEESYMIALNDDNAGWGTNDFHESDPVPEPSTILLLSTGLLGLGGWRRRKNQKK